MIAVDTSGRCGGVREVTPPVQKIVRKLSGAGWGFSTPTVGGVAPFPPISANKYAVFPHTERNRSELCYIRSSPQPLRNKPSAIPSVASAINIVYATLKPLIYRCFPRADDV